MSSPQSEFATKVWGSLAAQVAAAEAHLLSCSNTAHACPQKLYRSAGIDGQPVVFLLTDNQITNEGLLEDVNNLLNSGEVPGMFTQEEKDQMVAGVRDWVDQQGGNTSKVRLQRLAVRVLMTILHAPSLMLMCCRTCRGRIQKGAVPCW